MQIITKTKNIELTKELHRFIDSRLGALKKFNTLLAHAIGDGKTLAEIFLEIEKETQHHNKGDIFKAEAIIVLPGKKLIAQAHGDNVKVVIIQVRDELKKEFKKYKAKTVELPRRKYRKEKRDFS